MNYAIVYGGVVDRRRYPKLNTTVPRSDFIVHHDYNHVENYKNDIALLRLKEILNEDILFDGTHIYKISLPDPYYDEKLLERHKMTIMGFGPTTEGAINAFLQSGVMEIFPNHKCLMQTHGDKFQLPDNCICLNNTFGNKLTDGDSGSPGIVAVNGEYVLFGIASATYRNILNTTVFNIFTRVSSHLNWIDEHIGESDRNYYQRKWSQLRKVKSNASIRRASLILIIFLLSLIHVLQLRIFY